MPCRQFAAASPARIPRISSVSSRSRYYFDRAVDAGLVDAGAEVGTVTPELYQNSAERACSMDAARLGAAFGTVAAKDRAFLCLDLTFIHGLLVDGLGVAPNAALSLAKKMPYNGAHIETQWTLGAAIQSM